MLSCSLLADKTFAHLICYFEWYFFHLCDAKVVESCHLNCIHIRNNKLTVIFGLSQQNNHQHFLPAPKPKIITITWYTFNHNTEIRQILERNFLRRFFFIFAVNLQRERKIIRKRILAECAVCALSISISIVVSVVKFIWFIIWPIKQRYQISTIFVRHISFTVATKWNFILHLKCVCVCNKAFDSPQNWFTCRKKNCSFLIERWKKKMGKLPKWKCNRSSHKTGQSSK